MFTLIIMMPLQLNYHKTVQQLASKVNMPTDININPCNNRDYDLTEVLNSQSYA